MMRRLRMTLAALLAVVLPATAQAQALRCTIPGAIAVPHPELPSADQPARTLPIGGYTLAITWSPEYCQRNRTNPSATLECGGGNRFGFTLHGLWPDGEGATWPQYCAATDILPPATIRPVLCSTPSPQLVQHEWAKHGTCMAADATSYFGEEQRLYRTVHVPDMAALAARRDLTDRTVRQAIADANPGITADMVRLNLNRRGWLSELWFCLGRDKRPVRCAAPPANPGARVRVQAAGA